MSDSSEFFHAEMTLRQKLWQINWGLVVIICTTAVIGFAVLYSAGNGSIYPWAARQMVRFSAGLALMFVVALIDTRVWLRYAYLIYLGGLALLVYVDVFGAVGRGAQRWIDFGAFNLQPSEVMKVALVLALARYFHAIRFEEIGRIRYLVWPLVLVAVPAALVLRQPDLGTAMMLVLAGGAMFFMAGVRLWKFAVVISGALAMIPIAWHFLRDYQKQRILTFFNPESDPMGAGYHIIQSKIALGSGGIFGKGFLQGSQSHLNFVPEKQTDFVFTLLAEEFGIVGGLFLLALYLMLLVYGFAIAMRSRNQFGRLLAVGVTVTFFLYVFINIAMVMGVLPVVGVPLPLVSYGGTSMLTLLLGFGLLMGVYIHRDVGVDRSDDAETL
jgi:rod shape determining protein RodA